MQNAFRSRNIHELPFKRRRKKGRRSVMLFMFLFSLFFFLFYLHNYDLAFIHPLGQHSHKIFDAFLFFFPFFFVLDFRFCFRLNIFASFRFVFIYLLTAHTSELPRCSRFRRNVLSFSSRFSLFSFSFFFSLFIYLLFFFPFSEHSTEDKRVILKQIIVLRS